MGLVWCGCERACHPQRSGSIPNAQPPALSELGRTGVCAAFLASFSRLKSSISAAYRRSWSSSTLSPTGESVEPSFRWTFHKANWFGYLRSSHHMLARTWREACLLCSYQQPRRRGNGPSYSHGSVSMRSVGRFTSSFIPRLKFTFLPTRINARRSTPSLT
jgi:hypothetical protein